MPKQYGYGQQQPQMPMPAMPPAGTFTGAGPDGIVQPGAVAGDVHEGEMVFDARTAQAIPQDVFGALQQNAERGTLNVDALRSALGIQQRPGYAGGTHSAGTENPNNQAGAITGTLPNTASSSPVDFYKRANDRIKSSVGLDTTPAETPQPPVGTNGPESAESAWRNRPITGNAPVVTVPTRLAPVETFRPAEIAPIQQPQMQTPAIPTRTELGGTSIQLGPVQDRTGYHAELDANGYQAWVKDSAAATTPTTATPTTPTGTLATDNVRRGMQITAQQMEGMSDADKRIMNNALLNMDATAAAQLQAKISRISSDPDLSDAGKRTAIAREITAASASRNNTIGTLSVAAAERAGTAAQNAISTGQQVRTYEDVTLPQAKITSDASKIAMQNAADSQINNRISMLVSAGKTPEEIASDETLKGMISSYMGSSATPEQIAGEVGSRTASLYESGKANYATNMETTIGDSVDNGMTDEEIINDRSIRQNAAGYLGAGATEEQITAEIQRRMTEIKLPEVDRIINNMVKNGWIDSDAAKVDGFRGDMEKVIRDLKDGGAFDEQGNFVGGVVVDWPWDAPSTYFKYTDFNGEEVKGGTISSLSPVTKDGVTPYTDANGMAITNGAAMEKWNSLTDGEREALFSNGKPNIAAFMKKAFPTTLTPEGKEVPLTTIDGYSEKYSSDTAFAEAINTVVDGYSDDSLIPKTLSEAEGGDYSGYTGTVSQNFAGNFHYYDEYGNYKTDTIKSAKFGNIVNQLSEKYNKGVPFRDADDFNNYWQNGEGWYIDKNGNATKREESTPVDKIEIASSAISSFKPSTINSDHDSQAISGSAKESYGSVIPEEAAKIISGNWDDVDESAKAKFVGFDLFKDPTVSYRSSDVTWNMSNELAQQIIDNRGKLVKAPNGRIYEIVGWYNANYSNGNTGAVVLRDVVENKLYDYNNVGGSKKAKRYKLREEGYV